MTHESPTIAQSAARPSDDEARLLRASPAERLVQLVLAAAAWALLAVAWSLTPAAEGLGTHEQLGLQPCTFHQLTSQPCPSCGMTTAFSLMAHGRLPEALLAQPFAALLFVLVLAAAVGLTAAAVAGRSLRPLMYSTRVPLALTVLVVLWLAGWGFKIFYGALHGGVAP